jgi:hypothetical protein
LFFFFGKAAFGIRLGHWRMISDVSSFDGSADGMEDQFIDDSNSNSNDLLLGRVSSGACLEWFFFGCFDLEGRFRV